MKRNPHSYHIICLLAAAVLIYGGCAASPDRPDPSQPAPARTPPPEPASTVEAAPPPPAPTPTPGPPIGWILNQNDRESVQGLISQADDYQVDQVHLTGEFLHSIDELIYDYNKFARVESIAQELERKNIDLILWSHELNLTNSTFMFMPDDPLTAARKAAYANVLNRLPEIDGIMLVMEDAPVEPWNAEIPPLHPQHSTVARIQFVIEMIRDTVAGEHDKQLWVKTSRWNEQRNTNYAKALQGLPPQDVRLLVSPHNQTPGLDDLSGYARWGEIDLTGEQFGGPRLLVSRIDPLRKLNEALGNGRYEGALAWVQSQYGDPLASPNQVNLQAFSMIKNSGTALGEPLWDNWLKKQYGIRLRSREGAALQRIYQNTAEWSRRMALALGSIPVTMDGSIPETIEHAQQAMQTLPPNHAQHERIKRELENRNKQFLIDLKQEGFEALQQIDQALQQLENLRSAGHLSPAVFEAFSRPLRHQRAALEAFDSVKQSLWGYEFWRQTRDPWEALHLEAELRNLEALSDRIEDQLGPTVEPANPEMLLSLVESIRAKFPRVILGGKEREWNRLQNITLRQVGPDRIEVGVKSDSPSLAKVFISDALPYYSRIEPVSKQYTVEHRAVVSELEPGKSYYLKIQCENERGIITNSGDFLIYLEPEAYL